MEIAKFFSDLTIVTLATALVLAPHALNAYLARREPPADE